MKSVRETVKGNEQQMAKSATQFPEYECILSIPGFGPIVSAMVLAAILKNDKILNVIDELIEIVKK